MDENQYDVYVLVKFLGQGSFGRVNLYRNTTDNSLVVWKEIALGLLDAKAKKEAFAEVEILSMLNHPNIIGYYKHYIDDFSNHLYIELEYAKAGNLANLIKKQKELDQYFSEDMVMWWLFQLLSAIDYIHSAGIMHRDIKSLNIFFMQSGLLKLGDFGIAKILESENALLESQVGTPLYMSPELIEGKKYSTKTDIWSVGCVCFEIMTLTKVFDATNQLKLAMKISTQEVPEIEVDAYTEELRKLVGKILTKNPDLRPNAKEILDDPLFKSRRDEFTAKVEDAHSFSPPRVIKNYSEIAANPALTPNNQTGSLNSTYNLTSTTGGSIVASKSVEVYVWGGGKILPKKVESFKNEKAPIAVALGSYHCAVITVEKELYTWSSGQTGSSSTSHAKLGHGKNFGQTRVPKLVESLAGISITKVACGEESTYCISESGDLYVFGTNLFGCLGFNCDQVASSLTESGSSVDNIIHDDSVYIPVKHPFFSSNNLRVRSIASGCTHVICLTENSRVFVWGCGEYGRLGLGDEEDRYEPSEIKLDLYGHVCRDVFAGSDTSFILTNKGKVLAWGNNEYNKICLNFNPVGFKHAKEDDNKLIQNSNQVSVFQQLTPSLIKSLLPYTIIKVCPGLNHTAAIDCFGRIFTFGSNQFGQLGVGHTRVRTGLNLVGGVLVGHNVINAACGDSFTVCATSENHVFSWGNRKDGRLGLDSTFDHSACVCVPKPMFGSLHQVSGMDARGWNSIIIAEQILNFKPVRSASFTRKVTGSTSSSLAATPATPPVGGIEPSIFEDVSNSDSSNQESNKQATFEIQRPASILTREQSEPVVFEVGEETEFVPEWLKAEADGADFIPIDALNKSVNLNDEIQTLEQAIQVINRLKSEINVLKEENEKLKLMLPKE